MRTDSGHGVGKRAGRRLGRWRPAVVVALALGLLNLSAPAVAEPAAPAAPAASKAPAPACADEATGEQAAVAMAATCDAEVEIVDKRTETDEYFAQPDGSTTLRRYTVPQRVRRGTSWEPIDARLQVQPDGSVRPRAVPLAMTFSGGGTAPFVSVVDGASKLALTWPTALPKPTIDSDTATYPEVMPGVDLRLTASIEGFQQVLVVKNRTAAANPALAKIATRVTTAGLTLRAGPGGRIDAVNTEGKMVFYSDGSTMWDSPGPAPTALRAETGVAGVGRTQRVMPMGVELKGDQLVVTPDRAMLTAPTTTYPVSIDPPWSRGSGGSWTTVRSCASNTSYWSSKRDAMRVGNDPGQTSCVHRVFVNIPVGDLAGAMIKNASFFAHMDHSSPCGTTPQVRLAVTTQTWIQPGANVTWNNTSDYNAYRGWVVGYASPASANEAGGCGSDLGDKWVEWGMDPGNVQWFTNQSYGTITYLIYSTAENDWSTWKKFYPESGHIQLNYNHRPNLPTGQSITDCVSQCSSPALVSQRNPQLKTLASDPNNGNLNLYYTVQKADGTPVVTSPAVAHASGAVATPWRIQPALPADGAYRWNVKACDEWGDCSDPTGWFDFTVDTAPPPAAQVDPVNPALYFRETGSGSSSGGIGVPGQLILKGNAATASFTWRLDSGASTTVAATGTNPRTATITVVPQADLVRTLTVTVRNNFGRETTSTYPFRVASPDPLAGYWNLNGNGLDSRDFSNKPNAVRHNGTMSGASWVDVTVPGTVQSPRFRGVLFDGAEGSMAKVEVDHPVLATLRNPAAPAIPRSYSVAAWVRFDGSVDEYRYRSAVSQQGVNKSHFEIGFQTGPESNYCFTMFATDTVSPQATRACVTGPVTRGEWVHIAGVYDDANHTATVYVHRLNSAGFVDFDGATTAWLPFTSTWSATGKFTIGLAYNGSPGAPFKGVVDEVYAAQYAATAEDVQSWAQAFEVVE